ncbi:uncharacterized protein QC764_0110940 [Podospora pseudoanserina]|uniref:Uncharacterized protein n=1 Tax=Podospora pseudoanserina TaxID=2609844 RepID=A0ABR0HIM3_9PEZI|nr:hypothetical protein QC764_0110940 [Podospora pseudoanserina]
MSGHSAANMTRLFVSVLALSLASTLANKISTPRRAGCSSFTTRYSTVTEHFPTATITETDDGHSPPTTMETTSLPDSCTFTGTQTFYSSSGCDLTCSTGFCIIDAAATRSCGCSRVEIETVTTTVCPTRTPCYQCYTGWGTFFYDLPCPTSVPVPTGDGV